MDEAQFADLGMVTNLAVIQKPGVTENLLLVGMSEGAHRWARVLTRGASQALWYHLTHVLYPRAAGQITPRAATAVLRHADSPTVTSFVEISGNEEQQIVTMRGMGGQENWMVHFSYQEGQELWASLEKALDIV